MSIVVYQDGWVATETWIQESNLLLEFGWLRKELGVDTFPIRQIQGIFWSSGGESFLT